jgi:solute carrier family 34 (sodium-dependent phosphate cotransporter)
MTETDFDNGTRRDALGVATRVVALFFFLYSFLVSIGLLGKAFKAFSGGFLGSLIESASNPLIGLLEGILVTTLAQSSSTTTSLVVAMVAGGTLPVASAIPIIMGANIGTSVTNTLVSLGHIGRGGEFKRAFAASTVHDFFNILAVIVLFPLQVTTNVLGRLSTGLADAFQEVGGLTFASPLQFVTEPVVDLIAQALKGHRWILLILSLVIMFGSLRYLVVTLKGLVLARLEQFFDRTLFRNAGLAMLFGVILTVMVQSSSITTSLVIPLAGAGVLTLRQIFPYTLGANVGTTVTAILAALSVGSLAAVNVAFAHMLFNVIGVALIWPIRAVRDLPIKVAESFAAVSANHRWVPIAYVVVCFYILPFAVIAILR